jgi:hypothetical protein
MTRMKLRFFGIALFFVVAAQADTLVLRNGKTLQGTLIGADARQVNFLTDAGKTEQISITDIDRINFGTPPATKTASPPKAAAATAPAKPSVVILAGTTIRVRTIDPIDVDSTKAGTKFQCSIDDPITINGNVVVPRGTDATLQVSKVQQSGKMKGSDLVELKLNSIDLNGVHYQLATSFQQISGKSEGKSTTKKVVGGAGLGAVIGAIAGGGKGAAIGAAVGGTGGAVISAAGEQHLKVPAETRLEFKLESDIKI